MRRLTIVLATTLGMWSCGGAAPSSPENASGLVKRVAPTCTSEDEILLSPLRTMGDALDGVTFGRIVGIAVAPNEDVVVLDGQSGSVTVLDSTGALRRRFGRKGSGPGETRYPNFVGVSDAYDIYIGNRQPAWISQFDSTGVLLDRFGTADFAAGRGANAVMGTWGMTRTGSIRAALFLVSSEVDSSRVVLTALDRGGTRADPLAVWNRPGDNLRFRIWGAYPTWALAADGAFVRALGEEHRLELFDSSGALRATVQGPGPRSVDGPLSERLLATFLQEMEAEGQSEFMIRTAGERAVVAPVLRAIERVWISRPENQIWVRGPAMDWTGEFPVEQRFWVYASEGDYLGCTEVPEAFRLLTVDRGRLFGEWRDELDIPRVRTYTAKLPLANEAEE